jgi:plastocyanin
MNRAYTITTFSAGGGPSCPAVNGQIETSGCSYVAPPDYNIEWAIPAGGDSYESVDVFVGETVSFTWSATGYAHDVFVHPSGTCDAEGAVLVGDDNTGTTYTFSQSDCAAIGLSTVTFACDYHPAHCLGGQIITFNVFGCAVGAQDCSGNFGMWTSCSASCGGGTQTQVFNVDMEAANGGTECDYTDGQEVSQACNTDDCPVPVDCVGSFGGWSDCSESCGDGTQTRTYGISVFAAEGGAECSNEPGDSDSQSCNLGPCVREITDMEGESMLATSVLNSVFPINSQLVGNAPNGQYVSSEPTTVQLQVTLSEDEDNVNSVEELSSTDFESIELLTDATAGGTVIVATLTMPAGTAAAEYAQSLTVGGEDSAGDGLWTADVDFTFTIPTAPGCPHDSRGACPDGTVGYCPDGIINAADLLQTLSSYSTCSNAYGCQNPSENYPWVEAANGEIYGYPLDSFPTNDDGTFGDGIINVHDLLDLLGNYYRNYGEVPC